MTLPLGALYGYIYPQEPSEGSTNEQQLPINLESCPENEELWEKRLEPQKSRVKLWARAL